MNWKENFNKNQLNGFMKKNVGLDLAFYHLAMTEAQLNGLYRNKNTNAFLERVKSCEQETAVLFEQIGRWDDLPMALRQLLDVQHAHATAFLDELILGASSKVSGLGKVIEKTLSRPRQNTDVLALELADLVLATYSIDDLEHKMISGLVDILSVRQQVTGCLSMNSDYEIRRIKAKLQAIHNQLFQPKTALVEYCSNYRASFFNSSIPENRALGYRHELLMERYFNSNKYLYWPFLFETLFRIEKYEDKPTSLQVVKALKKARQMSQYYWPIHCRAGKALYSFLWGNLS